MSGSPRRHIVRVEITTMVSAALAGGVLFPFGRTPAQVSYLLFGWAGGCGLHLLTVAARDRLGRRRRES